MVKDLSLVSESIIELFSLNKHRGGATAMVTNWETYK